MQALIDYYPKPIQVEGRPVRRFTRKTAGHQHNCILCGRPTYRYVGHRPICSYCSEKYTLEELEKQWKAVEAAKSATADNTKEAQDGTEN